MMASTRPRPVAERFWEKVRMAGDCWEWTGNVSGGYGRINRSRGEVKVNGGPRGLQAHRWSYEELLAPIPPDLQLDHLCRNQICVNPWHLDPVPQPVNLRRGIGLSAQNARKTHCQHGHEFTIENTYLRTRSGGNVERECKRCINNQARTRRINKRAA